MAHSRSLSDLCEAIVDCPHSTPRWTDQGVVVLRNKNIRNGWLDLSNPSYTDEAHYAERTKRATPRAGDLVITREAPMGEVCMIPSGLRCCLGQRMVLLRPNPSMIVPRYLLYALQSRAVQHEIGLSEGTGSTVSNLRIPMLAALRIPTPSIDRQHAIADALGSLDDKIDLSRRMIDTLEQIVEALYKSWFIDFDPGRLERNERNLRMPGPIADMYPNGQSVYGTIPTGWDIRTLGETVETVAGRSYRSAELRASDTALVTLKSFKRGGGYTSSGLKPYIGSYKPEQIVRPGEIILPCTDITQSGDVIGRPAIAQTTRAYRRLVASLDVIIVRPNASLMAVAFLYLTMKTREFLMHMLSHTTGTTVLHLDKSAIPSYRFVCPPVDIIARFDKLVEPVFERIQGLADSTQTLTSLRRTLLPCLIE